MATIQRIAEALLHWGISLIVLALLAFALVTGRIGLPGIAVFACVVLLLFGNRLVELIKRRNERSDR